LRGRFITFEGGEGVGKTTQIQRIFDRLAAGGRRAVTTREPGGTARAEQLRSILLDRADERMPPSCELLLMFAARATHLENLIKPSLESGAWVLCDRFTDATYAYQGGGRGLATCDIDALAGIVHPDLQPDLTILLDAPVETGLGRARDRNGQEGPDRFESERLEFFQRVRAAYLARADAEPERFLVVDATRSPDAVEATILDGIRRRLPEPG
jgi:dTMP kinase